MLKDEYFRPATLYFLNHYHPFTTVLFHNEMQLYHESNWMVDDEIRIARKLIQHAQENMIEFFRCFSDSIRNHFHSFDVRLASRKRIMARYAGCRMRLNAKNNRYLNGFCQMGVFFSMDAQEQLAAYSWIFAPIHSVIRLNAMLMSKRLNVYDDVEVNTGNFVISKSIIPNYDDYDLKIHFKHILIDLVGPIKRISNEELAGIFPDRAFGRIRTVMN